MAGNEIAQRRPNQHNIFPGSHGKSCGGNQKRKMLFAPFERKTLWPTRYAIPVDMRLHTACHGLRKNLENCSETILRKSIFI